DDVLLYKSSKVTYASGGIPIDVDVTGVNTLSLVVSKSGTFATNHAVWAAARVISTANFGASSPYSLPWQVARGDDVLSAQATDWFVVGSVTEGVFPLTLTVDAGPGGTATQSVDITVGLAPPSGFFVYPGDQQVELAWQPVSAASYTVE